MKRRYAIVFISIFLTVGLSECLAQLSPGKLTLAHAKLEGLSNCTACHELGKTVESSKCLDCHKEIKAMVELKKGYHTSAEVKGKECFACHSDHHGRNFQIVRFDTVKFNHQLAGYELKGKHAKISCSACHKNEFITTKKSQKSVGKTYLGLDTKCLSCHADYHQKTLSADCTSCHGPDSFKPTTEFKHQKTKFPLIGKHADVTCIKCHPKEKKEGKDFQKFSGITFNNCTDCHKDVHDNKFGNDCWKCHSENSFHQPAGMNTFDHSKTDFLLKGKHQALDCKKCHKGKYTTPIKSSRCTDCHSDYHKGQFSKKEATSDCKDCHNENGFLGSSFTFERHNNSGFILEGAHAATPCIACHKKEKDWQFSDLDKRCVACHENIHKNHIKEKFIPEGKCESCHTVINWNKVTFDHQTTTFQLQGKHAGRTCRDCHFKKENDNLIVQKFAELKGNCEECHTDVHQQQFNANGTTDCTKCHKFENWKAEKFDHNQTRFKLDGGHQNVECKKCHLVNKSNFGPFIQYKNTKMQCKNCHI
ncbi:MAG: cytochrome C [Bacteroidota bacterium]|nr:cytochrome C [Bacteroidota bacterium]